MASTGFIDHIGIGVPDLAEAKEYYDDLIAVLVLREWFETRRGERFNKLEAVCHSADES